MGLRRSAGMGVAAALAITLLSPVPGQAYTSAEKGTSSLNPAAGYSSASANADGSIDLGQWRDAGLLHVSDANGADRTSEVPAIIDADGATGIAAQSGTGASWTLDFGKGWGWRGETLTASLDSGAPALVSTSNDGTTWSAPVTADSDGTATVGGDSPTRYVRLTSPGEFDSLDGVRFEGAVLVVPQYKTADSEWIHGGIIHTAADLELMRDRVRSAYDPWYTAFLAFAADDTTSVDYQMYGPIEYIDKTPQRSNNSFSGNTTEERHQLMRFDAAAAYNLALMYNITRDERYGVKVRDILTAYIGSYRGITLETDMNLAAGPIALKMSSAADILTYVAAQENDRNPQDASRALWDDADTADLVEMFQRKTTTYPSGPQAGIAFVTSLSIVDIMRQEFLGNHGSIVMAGLMAYSVLAEDADTYNSVIDRYLNPEAGWERDPVHVRKVVDGGVGSSLFFIVHETGQGDESPRAQGYAHGAIVHLASVARMAYNQGDASLYEAGRRHLLRGYEYNVGYGLGHDVTSWTTAYPEDFWVEYQNTSDISSATRGQLESGYEYVYDYYAHHSPLAQPDEYKNLDELLHSSWFRPETLAKDNPGVGTLTTVDLSESSAAPVAAPVADFAAVIADARANQERKTLFSTTDYSLLYRNATATDDGIRMSSPDAKSSIVFLPYTEFGYKDYFFGYPSPNAQTESIRLRVRSTAASTLELRTETYDGTRVTKTPVRRNLAQGNTGSLFETVQIPNTADQWVYVDVDNIYVEGGFLPVLVATLGSTDGHLDIASWELNPAASQVTDRSISAYSTAQKPLSVDLGLDAGVSVTVADGGGIAGLAVVNGALTAPAASLAAALGNDKLKRVPLTLSASDGLAGARWTVDLVIGEDAVTAMEARVSDVVAASYSPDQRYTNASLEPFADAKVAADQLVDRADLADPDFAASIAALTAAGGGLVSLATANTPTANGNLDLVALQAVGQVAVSSSQNGKTQATLTSDLAKMQNGTDQFGGGALNNSTAPSAWYALDFGEGRAVRVDAIDVRSVKDNAAWAQRLSGTHLEGSNDGSSWTTITGAVPQGGNWNAATDKDTGAVRVTGTATDAAYRYVRVIGGTGFSTFDNRVYTGTFYFSEFRVHGDIVDVGRSAQDLSTLLTKTEGRNPKTLTAASVATLTAATQNAHAVLAAAPTTAEISDAYNGVLHATVGLQRKPVPDTERPKVTLVTPTTAGPFPALTIRVNATDNKGLQRIVANIYKDGTLFKSTQTAVGGAKSGSHAAAVSLPDGSYTVKYNAQDLAGNISQTSTFAVTIEATAPQATVKDGASFTVAAGSGYDLISFKLFDAGKIDKVTINGTVKNLTDNTWSDVNFVKPGTFGAVKGTNTLVVYDVAGNTSSFTFTLN